MNFWRIVFGSFWRTRKNKTLFFLVVISFGILFIQGIFKEIVGFLLEQERSDVEILIFRSFYFFSGAVMAVVAGTIPFYVMLNAREEKRYFSLYSCLGFSRRQIAGMQTMEYTLILFFAWLFMLGLGGAGYFLMEKGGGILHLVDKGRLYKKLIMQAVFLLGSIGCFAGILFGGHVIWLKRIRPGDFFRNQV